MTQSCENKKFRILSAIGIILVVAGHLGYPVFDMGGWFPYYSFHVFIFLFVSGYFYKPESEQQIGRYLLKKCKKLLLPYFAWNVIYGVFAALLHTAGFSIGQKLSLYTLLVAPFEGGHQFMYNFPAWFVPVLFLIEAINVCARKVLSLLKLNNEWLIFVTCLLMGMITVWLAIRGSVWGFYKIPGRILFMLPGFQLGRLYQAKLKQYDKLPSGFYFMLLIGLQIAISAGSGGLAFSAVWVSSFANGPVIPYLTVATGIFFWLRVAAVLEEVPRLSQQLCAIGRNTFAIMMHHIFAFFTLNSVFFGLHCLTPLCADFDAALYKSDVNYLYLPGGAEVFKWIYLILGIAMPIVIGQLQEMVAKKGLRLEKGLVNKTKEVD